MSAARALPLVLVLAACVGESEPVFSSPCLARRSSGCGCRLLSPPPGEVEYVIERRQGTDPFDEIARKPSDVDQYDDAPLAAGLVYDYRVAAVDDVGDQAYSEEISIEME